MKTATIEDFQHRFPSLEAWLQDGESIAIVREGVPVALLTPFQKPPIKWADTPVGRMSEEERAAAFRTRFGNPTSPTGPATRVVDMLIEERGS